MNQPIRIFIGYDSREPIAFSVLVHSILRRSSCPVSITALTLQSVRRIYTRRRGPTESTEFSMTRFLVPYLSDYQGHSLFMDCDMLCLTDIAELWAYALAYPGNALMVCPHDYTPSSSVKFLNQTQTVYPKKNQSSLMLFDNAKCKALTPEYVNTASGLDLHRFNWTTENAVGALPLEFNWLVGEYPKNDRAKVLHFTLGGPYFSEYASCDHADLWFAEKESMSAPALVTV